MDIIGVIIALAAASAVIWTVFYNVKRIKHGKSCACCGERKNGCAGCADLKTSAQKPE